jgi:uncharacterized surface protein with fasciclin (FAS1) repeats
MKLNEIVTWYKIPIMTIRLLNNKSGGTNGMKNLMLIYLVFLALAFIQACGDDIELKPEFGDEVYRTLEQFVVDNEEEYSLFIELMEATNMVDVLCSYNPKGNNYTLFLPTNAAFNKFIDESERSYSSFDHFLEDEVYCNSLIRYHMVSRELHTNEFTFGQLPDSTLGGDYLTIGFGENLDSTVFKVNNIAPITHANIQNYNGYIHVLSKVLEPIVYSSYEYLGSQDEFTIIHEAFQITGLADTMGIYVRNDFGKLIDNQYTLIVEADSVFNREGIFSIEDLIALKSPDNQDYTDISNSLYQFVSYHILEGRHFLDQFESRNYNTYASMPVSVVSGFDIRINRGVEVFEININGTDTVDINYIELDYINSNILSKNGAIHRINHVMDLFQPQQTTQIFSFRDGEQVLQEAFSEKGGEYFFEDDEDFLNLNWSGVDQLIYYSTSSASELAWNDDYILVDGNFVINYQIPKIMAGSYMVELRAHRYSSDNATVQVFIDGKKIGGNVNLTSGGTAGNPYGSLISLGNIEFKNTKRHTITVSALIPGQIIWDAIRFNYENE